MAATLYFPDYELPWVIRCDASEFAVGAVLFQTRANADGEIIHEPIAFSSKRFSEPATNWDAYKREAYAIYHSVHSFAWYLRGKEFVVESDHRNLQWIESSESPIVVRWRALLQSFNFKIRHIAGRENKVADWMSRQSDPNSTIHSLSALSDGSQRPVRNRKATQALFRDNGIAQPRAAQTRKPSRPHETTPDMEFDQPDINSPHLDEDMDWWQPTSVTQVMPTHIDTERVQLNPDQVQMNPSEVHVNTGDTNNQDLPSFEEMMAQVHGHKQLHFGASRTLDRLREKFPSARISMQQVIDYVRECPMCQKTRNTGIKPLPAKTLSLKPEYYRRTIGMDHFTVSPATEDGYIGCLLLVEHFSHFPVAYPVKSYDAETVARILFRHFCTYGKFDQIASDPGSAFTSEVILHLSKFLGFVHKVSLVGRHESNGCEGSVKQYLRHLKTLVHDQRLINRWADDTVLCLINFHLASFPTSETGGLTPFQLKYGSDDAKYFNLDTFKFSNKERCHALIKTLNENIKLVRAISFKAQTAIAEERRRLDGIIPQYMVGDLVLLDRLEHDCDFLPEKLAPRYLGPYEVLQQDKNDLYVKHMVMRTNHSYHVTRFKPFVGTRDAAFELAKIDKNQVSIVSINYFTGNPFLRTSLVFNITFDDGTIDRPYDLDLFDTEPFERFVERDPVLFPLRFTARQAQTEVSKLRIKPLVQLSNYEVQMNQTMAHLTAGNILYLHMRFFDFSIYRWYDNLGFPDKVKPYYVPIRIGTWNNRRHTQLKAYVVSHSNKCIVLDYFDVYAYVKTTVLPEEGYVLDETDKTTYPRAWIDLIEGPTKPLAIPRN